MMLAWVIAFLWMALIFTLSAQPREQSNELSMSIAQKIMCIITNVVPYAEMDLERFNLAVRKSAHFFAYLALGLMVANALRVAGVKRSKLIIMALLICLLYALSDEIHQYFVPGRGCQLKDVFLDTLGGAVGIMAYICLIHSVSRTALHSMDND